MDLLHMSYTSGNQFPVQNASWEVWSAVQEAVGYHRKSFQDNMIGSLSHILMIINVNMYLLIFNFVNMWKQSKFITP